MKMMAITEFLSWAFVHELPKGGGSGGLQGPGSAWSAITGFAELLTVVDTGHYEPLMFFEQGEPHPDAIKAGEAVAALANHDFPVPDDWNPFPDWPDKHGLIGQEVTEARVRHQQRPARSRREHVVQLVVSAAVLGRGPSWEVDQPKVRMVMRRGKPAWFIKRHRRDVLGRSHIIEVNGINPTTRRPFRGAYRRYELSDSLVGSALSRLDYLLWIEALHHVRESLGGKLENHRIAKRDSSRFPWISAKGNNRQPIEKIEVENRSAV